MSSDEELADVKSTIRALLVSDPTKCRMINELCYHYKELEGVEVPFRKFGCRNSLEFLRLMPDTVKVSDPSNRNSWITPVITEENRHVYELVSNQRRPSAPRRSLRSMPPRMCRNRQPFSRSNYQPHQNLGPDLAARPRPPLTDEFKKDVYRLLVDYPKGLEYDHFRSHVSRLLENHYLSEYRIGEVLNGISEFAFLSSGKVHLLKSSNQDRHRDEEHDREVADLCSNESDYEAYDEGSDFDEDLDMPSISRAPSRASRKNSPDGASDKLLYTRNLRNDLRSLFDDPENGNGIWLMKLKETYHKKFLYPLSPEEHGFHNLMDLVANLSDVFTIKRYRIEGDLLLLDARTHPQAAEDSVEEKGEIPITLLEKLKRLLKQEKQLYTEDLQAAYKRMYQQTLKPEDYGFKDMDGFLKHLEDTCRASVRFRQIVDRTLIKLQYEEKPDAEDSERSERESALPSIPMYNPFPPNVCDIDCRLEADPVFEEVKDGDTFEVNLGEVYSPGRFYITHIKRVPLLSQVMNDLNDFYDCNESKYEMLPSLISRNLLCVCKYSKTSEWHRVRVMSGATGKVKVLFVDYGTVEEVDLHKLRYLHEDFAKIPPLCMLARLSGIQPKDGRGYAASIQDAFYQMYKNVDLEVEIVRKREDSLEVLLYALTEEDRVLVQDQLVAFGYVAPKDDEAVPGSSTDPPSVVELHSSPVRPASTELSELDLSPVNIANFTLQDRASTTSKTEDTRPTEKRNTIAFFNRMVTDSSLKEKVRSEVRESNVMQTLRSDEPQEQNLVVPDPYQMAREPPPGFPFSSYRSHALPAEVHTAHGGVQTPYQSPYQTAYDHHVYGSPYPCYPPSMQMPPPNFQYHQNYQFPTGGSSIGPNYPYNAGNAAATNFQFRSAPPGFHAPPQFSASTSMPSTSYSSYSSTPTSYTPYLSQTAARIRRPPPGFDELPPSVRSVPSDQYSRSPSVVSIPKPFKPLKPPKPLKPVQPETAMTPETKRYLEQMVEQTLLKFVGIKSEESVAKGRTVEEVERLLLARQNINSQLLEVLDPVSSSKYKSDEASAKVDEFSKAHSSEFGPKPVQRARNATVRNEDANMEPYEALRMEERAGIVTPSSRMTADNRPLSLLTSAMYGSEQASSASTPTSTVKETDDKFNLIRNFVLKLQKPTY